jgi:tRNA (guanine10-N2)-dimethyltransferase
MGVADIRNLPVKKADCIVTDPPYGRSATTLGRETSQILNDFFSAVENCIPKRRRICVAAPKLIRISELGEEAGFKSLESHSVYVHRSLTREVAVLERA